MQAEGRIAWAAARGMPIRTPARRASGDAASTAPRSAVTMTARRRRARSLRRSAQTVKSGTRTHATRITTLQ